MQTSSYTIAAAIVGDCRTEVGRYQIMSTALARKIAELEPLLSEQSRATLAVENFGHAFKADGDKWEAYFQLLDTLQIDADRLFIGNEPDLHPRGLDQPPI